MSDKTFKQQVEEIVCGICKFKAWCEFDARERNAGADVDSVDDCGHIKEILSAHNAELDRMQKALRMAANQAYQNEIIDTEMKHISIGRGKEWDTKEDWLKDRIAEWES